MSAPRKLLFLLPFPPHLDAPHGGGKAVAQLLLRQARLLLSLFRGKPLWVTDWANHAYAARLRLLVQRWEPDIIHVDYHIMGQYLDALTSSKAPRVLTEHEPAQRAAPYLRSHSLAGQVINHYDKRAWRHFERAVIDQVQAVVVFTDVDKLAIQQLAACAPVLRIPLGVDHPKEPLDPLGAVPPSLLFFGSFIHPPNADAALRLIR